MDYEGCKYLVLIAFSAFLLHTGDVAGGCQAATQLHTTCCLWGKLSGTQTNSTAVDISCGTRLGARKTQTDGDAEPGDTIESHRNIHQSTNIYSKQTRA